MLVDFSRFDFDFMLQARRHCGEGLAVDVYSRLLHAGQHWDERKVNVVIYLQQTAFFDLPAKRARKPAGDIGRFRHVATQFRSEEHTSELQSHSDLVCRLLLEKKKKKKNIN